MNKQFNNKDNKYMIDSNNKKCTHTGDMLSGGLIAKHILDTPDPTQNVLMLVEAAVTRLNDVQRIEFERIVQLQAAESRRIDEVMKLRSEFNDKLSIAESKRIDAIRAVDVGAVAVASERATQQATVLANQVTTSADALRTLVATTATAMATQNQNSTTQFTDRLASLEKAQYENKGKSGLADPMLIELVSEMKHMREEQAQGLGKSKFVDPILTELVSDMKNMRESQAKGSGTIQGISSSWGVLIAIISALALFIGVYTSLKGPTILSHIETPASISQPAR